VIIKHATREKSMAHRKNPRSRPANEPLLIGGNRPNTSPRQMSPLDLELAVDDLVVGNTLIQRLGEYANRLGESGNLIDSGLKGYDDAVNAGLLTEENCFTLPSSAVLAQLEDARDDLFRRKALAMISLAHLVRETVEKTLPEEPTAESIRKEFRLDPPPVIEFAFEDSDLVVDPEAQTREALSEVTEQTLYDLKASLAEEGLKS